MNTGIVIVFGDILLRSVLGLEIGVNCICSSVMFWVDCYKPFDVLTYVLNIWSYSVPLCTGYFEAWKTFTTHTLAFVWRLFCKKKF